LCKTLPDGPVYARVDRSALEQVILNLLSNAVKYMGGPDRPARRITVSLTVEGERLILRVSDTGMGISDEARLHIFEQFYRADDDTVQAVPGSGLGLTLVKAHVDGHGGTIAVESVPGEGSTFVICLPTMAEVNDL
jgi:hypothetical protein